ncbi:EAL domain-containing protein [uncultured Sneathiella sp.]|jgi:diguanylate cyclase (GGDEF)-like protein|uniref:bifunctional diguanylate cyclase/phosphodiesterase n=2 Tax=uncultured Sneathiella sp. TaxID=879315 RepID=UPI0030DAFF44|tara:strand:+ start:264 stop:2342 length:2079 start_codon:yes stop_codon:yes gene_type:complete
MTAIFLHLFNGHSLDISALALILCAVGSVITIRLFERTRVTTGVKKAHWVFVAGLAGGCTIWSTHFLAMVSFQPGVTCGYQPSLTIASFFTIIFVCILGFFVSSATKSSTFIELGGLIVGGGIALMHYMGMSAYIVAGDTHWDKSLVIASILFGMLFGGITANRISRPVTRFCRYGSALSFFLAILLTHFVGMAAFSITADPNVYVPPSLLPDNLLVVGTIGVMVLMVGSGFSLNILDNKSKIEAAEHIRHLSQMDPLTGLPLFQKALQKMESRYFDKGNMTAKLAFAILELEGLRQIREVHGQHINDRVICIIADRLSRICTENEIIARGRGDTLVAISMQLFSNSSINSFFQKLEMAVEVPIEENGQIFNLHLNAGISHFPENAEEVALLPGQAELALTRTAHNKGSNIVVYDRNIDEGKRTLSALAMDLRYAVEREELELYYQPQNDVMTGDLIGFEVLLRWNHAERGMISPDNFIPLAEETGLIIPIGEWVLRTACECAAGWDKPYKIAVNVAPAQLTTGDLPAKVRQILKDTGLPHQRLELEITETSIIEDHLHTLHVVQQLKQIGISLAMDDFGTGYSSLSMLQTFPFDKIKIDRSFISGVSENPHSAAIARATIVLANGLQINSLAEGVEDQKDLNFLREIGCHEAQGYFFGKPMPFSGIEEMVNPRENAVTFNKKYKLALVPGG